MVYVDDLEIIRYMKDTKEASVYLKTKFVIKNLEKIKFRFDI